MFYDCEDKEWDGQPRLGDEARVWVLCCGCVVSSGEVPQLTANLCLHIYVRTYTYYATVARVT